MDYRDKVVVVTGAGSGIGREIALTFAGRGTRLALADISEKGLCAVRDELGTGGNTLYTETVDVSRADECGEFCDAVYREMGRVDILCNNAGVAVGGDFQDVSLQDWEWIVGVNLWGVIHGCHFFYPRMIAQGGGGHIVNIASAAGLFPAPFSIPYVSTKHGVVGLSQTLRSEAALHGIGVSAICPGFVLSNIYRNARQCTPPASGTQDESIAETERKMAKRRFTAASVAEAVVEAVDGNKGVMRLCPETYACDVLHRVSRGVFGSLMALVVAASKRGTGKT